MNVLSKILFFLADMPFSATVADRQVLIDLTGFNQIRSELNWEGSAISFCDGLLEVFHQKGQASLLLFTERLLAIDNLIGAEKKDQLVSLRAELEQVPDNQWASLNERLPRIFISYDIKDDPNKGIVEKLYGQLEGWGFEVFCNTSEHTAEDNWRFKLMGGPGACDGGVIFISDQNPSASEFLYTEAVILRWRDWLERHFKLITVCLSSDARRFLYEDKWARLGFLNEELLCDQPEEILLEHIKDHLGSLKGPHRRMSPIEKKERRLAGLLKGKDTNFLKEALSEIGEKCCYNTTQLLIETRLAREILREGMKAFPSLVKTLRGVVKKRAFEDTLELIAPSWVDLRSASHILKIITKPNRDRVFCVNGDIPSFTGPMYVQQAYYDIVGSEYSKRVIEVTGKDGDFTLDFVLMEIRLQLISRFNSLTGLPDDRIDNALINSKLEAFERNEGPMFVLFPPHLVEDEELLEEVRNTYPSLVFFLMMGIDAQKPPREGIEFLEPFLLPGEEQSAQIEYDDSRDLIPII